MPEAASRDDPTARGPLARPRPDGRFRPPVNPILTIACSYTAVTNPAPHPLASWFAEFLAFLLAGIAECGGRRQIAGPLTIRLQRRFNKMARRFAALLAHLAEFGADAPVRAWHRKQPPAATAPQGPAQNPPEESPKPAVRRHALPLPQAVRVPGRRAWLVGLSPNVNCAAGRLQHMMNDPEMVTLLAASPRLVALLRPLCRMLGVEFPPGILPPPPPRAPRKPRPRRWRVPRRGDLLFLLRMGKPIPGT